MVKSYGKQLTEVNLFESWNAEIMAASHNSTDERFQNGTSRRQKSDDSVEN